MHFMLQVVKQKPKTIESMRVADDTMVAEDDEEVYSYKIFLFDFKIILLLHSALAFTDVP